MKFLIILILCMVTVAVHSEYSSEDSASIDSESAESEEEEEQEPECLANEVYMARGPGPFCYPTCCGPRGPPCVLSSFTSGCFCNSPNFVKKYQVANNTEADPKNPCVRADLCTKIKC